MLLGGFAFPFLCYVKGLQSEKAQSPCQESYSILRCLTHLVWSQAFTSVTCVSRYVTAVI